MQLLCFFLCCNFGTSTSFWDLFLAFLRCLHAQALKRAGCVAELFLFRFMFADRNYNDSAENNALL